MEDFQIFIRFNSKELFFWVIHTDINELSKIFVLNLIYLI